MKFVCFCIAPSNRLSKLNEVPLNSTTTRTNNRTPFLTPWLPRDTDDTRSVIPPQTTIGSILSRCRRAQIKPLIIQAISILMVYLLH